MKMLAATRYVLGKTMNFFGKIPHFKMGVLCFVSLAAGVVAPLLVLPNGEGSLFQQPMLWILLAGFLTAALASVAVFKMDIHSFHLKASVINRRNGFRYLAWFVWLQLGLAIVLLSFAFILVRTIGPTPVIRCIFAGAAACFALSLLGFWGTPNRTLLSLCWHVPFPQPTGSVLAFVSNAMTLQGRFELAASCDPITLGMLCEVEADMGSSARYDLLEPPISLLTGWKECYHRMVVFAAVFFTTFTIVFVLQKSMGQITPPIPSSASPQTLANHQTDAVPEPRQEESDNPSEAQDNELNEDGPTPNEANSESTRQTQEQDPVNESAEKDKTNGEGVSENPSEENANQQLNQKEAGPNTEDKGEDASTKNQGRPGDGKSQNKPGDGNREKAEADGKSLDKPGDGNKEKAEADGKSQDKPGDGNKEKAEADGKSQDKPADGNKEKAEADGKSQDKPADGNKEKAEADGKSQDKPADNKQKARTSQNKQESNCTHVACKGGSCKRPGNKSGKSDGDATKESKKGKEQFGNNNASDSTQNGTDQKIIRPGKVQDGQPGTLPTLDSGNSRKDVTVIKIQAQQVNQSEGEHSDSRPAETIETQHKKDPRRSGKGKNKNQKQHVPNWITSLKEKKESTHE